jgi:hypothetical protein
MIVWCVIAAVLVLVFAVRAIECCVAVRKNDKRRSKPLFEAGREREVFYVPGDFDDADDDFEDL